MEKRTCQGAGKGRQGDAQAHANPNAERKDDGLCRFLTQVAKVVNVRPVPQESSTTDDSEDEKVDGLLGKHAFKKTVRRSIVQKTTNPRRV